MGGTDWQGQWDNKRFRTDKRNSAEKSFHTAFLHEQNARCSWKNAHSRIVQVSLNEKKSIFALFGSKLKNVSNKGM